ncbi:hypothetical protein SH1V18_48410 [Vallitalea longa]|uniref:Uncharacterized protein n=1 Tax=Vallitalea longa TaxID=2936439 RepID=A0A9W5YGR0_9FIRM|nr:hypothetical protein [Vallitalea longa]GKX32361.1 hypothetical protein SH1V18_48410 [Vallitalea longa]
MSYKKNVIHFACLMETTLEFDRSQCQSFFKAYSNMSVLDSFTNRRCIFAIYTKENWILGSIEDLCNSNDNMYLWKMFVNDETLFNVAYNIDETIV